MIKIIGYLFNIKAEIKIQVRENDMRAVEVRLQNASMQAGIEKNPVIQWQYGERRMPENVSLLIRFRS